MFFSLLFFSCENDIVTVNKIKDLSKIPAETGHDVEVLYSDSGHIKVKLLAPVLNRYSREKPYTELPKGLKLYFYDAAMNVENQLTAGYGISYEDNREMVVRNNVSAINEKGEKLNTEELIWKEKEGKIYSDKYVEITTEDEIIYGYGFEANQDFTNYKIKNIKGTINVKEDQIP